MLLNVVATFHFAYETSILVNSVFTAWWFTPTSVHTSLTSVATTRIGCYMYQPNNCGMMVLGSSTRVFYFLSFMNSIPTLFFNVPTMIPAIQKLTTKTRLSIQSNLQFRLIFIVLHNWTSVCLAGLLVTSILISSALKLIYGHRFPARRSID